LIGGIHLIIGYVPQSTSLQHPADRRRVVYWAKDRGHEVTQDLTRVVDVYLLSGVADFTMVPKLQRRAPVIIDLIDGYLLPQNPLHDLLRGFGKELVARNIGVPSKYTTILSKALSQADGVLCATPEQKNAISFFNPRCFDVLDFHEEFPFRKYDSRTVQVNKILWEGQPYTISGLSAIQKQLKQISVRNDFELTLVTDTQTPRYLGKFGTVETSKRIVHLEKILRDKIKLHPWSIQTVIEETQNAAVSLLPLDKKNFLNPLKPENRLLIMWRLGVPCLASPNLAYQRVMSLAGIQNVCNSQEEWSDQIISILENPKEQKEIVEKGQAYIQQFHGLNDTLLKWDEAFESIVL
jgi:hypothetical protein